MTVADIVNDADTETLTQIYYEKIFPFKQICAWLSYGNSIII